MGGNPSSLGSDRLLGHLDQDFLALLQHCLDLGGLTPGAGGVWNWLSKGHPIADLALVQWEAREVVIVPDSDVFMRPDLLNAIYALGRELRNEGAVVRVAELPQGEQKVGLDDYLFAGGDVQNLESFSLDQRVFRSCRSWFGRWKLKTALAA